MKSTIIVDINVIVEYLKTGKGILPTAYEKFKMKISSVTYAELLASSTFADSSLEKEVVDFLKKYFEVADFDEKTAVETAKVLRDSELTLAQAVVAATAKAHGVQLLTDDKKSFEKVESLQFVEI